MIIFEDEIRDGLEEKVKASSKISYATELFPTTVSENEVKSISQLIAKATNKDQFDLHYLKTVLVSTGWNKNDDVFLPEEVWAARNTPEDKPFNFEHNEKDIIGHITDTYVIDDSNKVLASEKDLPNKFHIITHAVLYKSWLDKTLAERMESIIKEIGEGKWFVSMEALFPTFDYAVQDQDGNQKIISRNKETASLTKHLKIYGGTGEFNGYRLGRLLRNITFCGKGLVRKPANPESIIFAEAMKVFSTKSVENILKSEGNEMSVTIEELTKQNVELTKKLDDAQAKLRQFDVDKVKADLDKAHAEVTVRDEKISKLTESLKAAELAKAEIEKSKNELEKSQSDLSKKLTEAVENLNKIKAEQIKTNRVSALEKAGMTNEQAVAEFEKFAGVDDIVFASIVKLTEAAYAKDKKMMDEKMMKEEEEKKKKSKGEVVQETLNKVEEKVEPALNTTTASEKSEVEKTVASLAAFLEENIMVATKKKS